MDFQYPEDKKYFVDFLANGDVQLFNNRFMGHFDFRDPKIKRAEFNLIQAKTLKDLIQKHGKTCQLKICSNCTKSGRFNVDHFIPLSTNELNKKIRNQKRTLF